MSTTVHSPLETALALANSGLSVIPIRTDASKRPACKAWAEFQKRIPAESEIRTLFNGVCGLAIVAGDASAQLEILDCESEAPFAEFCALATEHDPDLIGMLPHVETPSGGNHLFYRCEEIAGNQKLAMRMIDGRPEVLFETRGRGGYVLTISSPPECHEARKPYRLIRGRLTQIPRISREQRALLLDCARSFNLIRKQKSAPVPRRRNDNGTRPGDVFADRVTWPEILEPHGWTLAGRRGEESFWRRPGKSFGFSATTNYKGSDLLYVFSTNGHPFEHETSYTKFCAFALLAHNGDFKAAARALAEKYGLPKKSRTAETVDEEAHETGGETGGETPRPTKYSDDALADIFSAQQEHSLRYVPHWGWLEWTGQRWRRIADVLVMERARPICRNQADLCKQDDDITPKVRHGLARALASAKTAAAVERFARGDRRHYAEVGQFDADVWLFNTPGGTIDLKTGKLQPHRQEDLITKISNATPKGDCPRWKVFLERVTGGNAELQGYLRRLCGYALVGDPREECLDFFYGSGGNGKGTFLATLEYVFGEYATVAGAETFTESKGEKHPCDVAKLAGARLVISNEIDEGQRWDEARIKTLTGRDVMTARFMRQDFFDFVPQFTLIIAGNHKPALKTVDESIRRRLHLVPFEVTIPVEQQNTNLKTELRTEANGILAWAVQGCLEWQRRRLDPPEIVLAATAEYLASEDTFGLWIEECCRTEHDAEERTAYLYESFRRWKTERGEPVAGLKTFTTKLTERGFERDRDMHGWKMYGLHLRPEERRTVQTAINERRAAEGKHEWWNR
jgi:P4 family phage/plasmid primase-like protien